MRLQDRSRKSGLKVVSTDEQHFRTIIARSTTSRLKEHFRTPAPWAVGAEITAVILALVILGLTTPGLYSTTNLLNLGNLATILGLATVGQTVSLLGEGLDLSVGAVAGMSFFALAQVSQGRNSQLAISLVVVFGLALAVGLLNAALVLLRGIPPFVATLGTLVLVQGVVVAWSQGVYQGSVPTRLQDLIAVHYGFVSLALLIFISLVISVGIILHFTLVGRWLYAIGLNPKAARHSGIPVKPVLAGTYVVCALFAATAGIMLGAYTGSVDPTAGQDLNLQSIAAAVIGGTSLFGGVGGAFGALGGTLLMTVALDVASLHGLSGQSQSLVTCLVLLAGSYVYLSRRQKG